MNGDRMSIFLVETYVIKPEKQAEFAAYKKKWKKFFGKVMRSDHATKLQPEFLALVVPGAYSMSIWNPVE